MQHVICDPYRTLIVQINTRVARKSYNPSVAFILLVWGALVQHFSDKDTVHSLGFNRGQTARILSILPTWRDLVGRLMAAIPHIVTLVIPIIDPPTKSP